MQGNTRLWKYIDYLNAVLLILVLNNSICKSFVDIMFRF